MKMKWEKESELAIKAVTAGVEILDSKDKCALNIKSKESLRDVVTEKDLLIEKKIVALLGADSEYSVFGEESFKQEKIRFTEPVWLIDPIDGTVNYISAIPLYAISVGIMDNFRFPVGSVIVPQQKELFYTIGNNGAFLNERKLRITPGDFQDALVACAFSGRAYNDDSARRREYEFFGRINDTTRGCVRLGSAAINVCYVAAGRFQAAYGLANKLWDVAGALAVATNAGAKLYIEWIEGTMLVNYVIGVENIADEIAGMLEKEKLANFK